MKRQAGILMPITSLPNRHGVGDFGKEAYQFIDYLSESNLSIWQILPLNPLGFGNSPYQPYSSKAMDEIYINLDILKEEGLLEEIPDFQPNTNTIDYQAVKEFKNRYIKKAFSHFKQNDEYLKLKSVQWVYHYAVFITFKKQNNLRCWNEWDDVYKNWIHDKNMDLTPFQNEIDLQIFIQYLLLKQWNKLKKYANDHGVQFIGDIPIYVGIDSLDVWENQSIFLLDDKGHPTFIAGVPPDYFSEDGQRWGNPLYNWELLEKRQFDFWIDRLSYNAKMFDQIRIDHFRAFDTYWKIPASCLTAKEGEWVEAPGYALFDTIYSQLPDIKIIAEDLGDLRPEVLELRDHYQLYGMRIVQFTWGKEAMEAYESISHVIAYTGSHDNQTIKGWFNELEKEDRQQILKTMKQYGYNGNNIAKDFVTYTMMCEADYAIIPIQDFLELDDSARINTPGTVGSPNWEYKLIDFQKFVDKIPYIRKLVASSNRIFEYSK